MYDICFIFKYFYDNVIVPLNKEFYPLQIFYFTYFKFNLLGHISDVNENIALLIEVFCCLNMSLLLRFAT